MNISIDPRPNKLSADVYIGRQEGDRRRFVTSVQVTTDVFEPGQELPGPSCEMTIPELAQIYTSLGAELSRLGYVKAPPSVEVVRELRERIASLESIIEKILKAGE